MAMADLRHTNSGPDCSPIEYSFFRL